MAFASALGFALLCSPTVGLRKKNQASVATEVKAASKLDIWAEIADGFRVPTQEDTADMVQLNSEGDFDFRGWGDEFTEETFEQAIDHLNAYHQQSENLGTDTTTFQQRYWINTKAWSGKEAKGPLFFIISPYGGFNPYAYGFIGVLARKVGAMVVQLEGRFTPGSLPFNESSFDTVPNRMGLMSGENALRDYVMLISSLRDQYDPDWVCPVATWGTSLAGMYAAWLRYKFPHIIDMSFASGSPMTGYPGTSDPLAFSRIITEAWEDAGDAECVDLVRDAFRALEGDNCHRPLYSQVYNEATYWSYPPRDRIPNACEKAKNMRLVGESDRAIALELCGSACAEGTCSGGSSSPSMWGYFACTQVVNPIGSNGVSDFIWPPNEWDVEVRRQYCLEDWGVEPQREGDYHAELFGWHHLAQLADNGKRMLFSFGSYDPWTGFALSEVDVSPEIPVFVVKGGTHGGDLVAPVAIDTQEMLDKRQIIDDNLVKWIADVQARRAASAARKARKVRK